MAPNALMIQLYEHLQAIEKDYEDGIEFTGFVMTRYSNPPDCFIEDKGVLDPLLKLMSEESQETVNQFVLSLLELVCSI